MKYKSVKPGMPRSWFECLRCFTRWSVAEPTTGQNFCPTCSSDTLYFTWVNFAVVINWLMKNDAEYRRSYGVR